MALELRRKSIHLIGLIVPIVYIFIERHQAVIAVGILVIGALVMELLKAVWPSFSVVFYRVFTPMLRTHERNGAITGATYFLVGAFLPILLFPKILAIVCILFMILGDMAAALIGKKWGRTKLFPRKSLEGSLACFLVCVLIAIVKLNPAVAIIGALAATVVEVLPIKLDDNLTMPLLSGLAMYAFLSG
ncbi:MAG: SEC59/DGK1/VTE5 family protein [Candidatus Poribacteria bacterium]|nr:SEC59/DGK1/VTE5 family protein [Candidatus Poribacteria bacterium]MDE0506878.1 SEC59/DGK1/VTE5 family protein [Candidatus Poribacteria bacterium]